MIAFDEATHTYTVDGVTVPSVTQLVAPLGADFDDPDEHLEIAVEAAADRGVMMHAYIAHRLQGGEPEEFELPTAYLPYADAVELFLGEHRIEPLLIETPLAGNGFAGTPDLVCFFDGDPAIVDYKFVSSVAKSKVGAQLAGYLDLCVENDIFPSLLYAVQFLRDGTYRLYPASVQGGREGFDACLQIYNLKCKKHPRGAIG